MGDADPSIHMKATTSASIAAARRGSNVQPPKVPESIFTMISQMTKFLTLYLHMESGGDSC